jgi:hypothetical protein
MEDLVNAVVVCQFLFYEKASRTFCVPTFAYLLLVPVHQALMLRMDSNGYPYEISNFTDFRPSLSFRLRHHFVTVRDIRIFGVGISKFLAQYRLNCCSLNPNSEIGLQN